MSKRTKYLLIAFLIAVSLLFILPPLVYHYQYPAFGDDTFDHLQQMDRVEAYYQAHPGQLQEVTTRYVGTNFAWLLWKIANGMTGIGMDYFFMWFNWLSMAVISLCLFYFGYKLFNWQAGVCTVLFAGFSSGSLSNFFYCGTIFNITNFYVFILMGILSFCLWQREKRAYYKWVSLLLFSIAGMYHSSSGLQMIAGMSIYLGGSLSWYAWKKDRENIIRVIKYGLLFGVMVCLPAWFLCPEVRGLIHHIPDIPRIETATWHPNAPVPFLTWMFWGGSPWALPLMALFGWILWQRKVRADYRVFGVLGSLIVFQAIGAFSSFLFENVRFALDLGGTVSIAAGCMAGLAIKARKNLIFTLAIAVVLIASGIPAISRYARYSSTYNPADQACVEMLNGLEGSSWGSSSQVQEGIYRRFVVNKSYVLEGWDYVIWRSRPMTARTSPGHFWWNCNRENRSESFIEDYQGLEVMGNWSFDNISVILYKGAE
jgi:hypothetical protein